MIRCIGQTFCVWILLLTCASAVTSLDTTTISKSIVFFFASDSEGHVLKEKLVATGFLIMVRDKGGNFTYPLLVTARHVVDPVWAGCESTNSPKLFIRVNNMPFDPKSEQAATTYLPVDLLKNGVTTWHKSDDDSVDVAVLNAPQELTSGKYDIKFLNFRSFGKPEEIAKLGISSQIASAGLIQTLEGRKRNNPIFHFGKIASIPSEAVNFVCKQGSQSRPFSVWWLASTLIPGTSGSPIFFDPLFPPGADLTAGEPRGMIIGLQSLSIPGADLAGMTPASYITDVISHAVGSDADLSLGILAH